MLSNKALSASKTVQPAYIEDVFSTWLYTGTGANLTINNGIDLAGKGGMTWFKGRNTATSHALFDTNRGAGYSIYSNATSAQSYFIDDLSSFTSTGFTLGDSATSGRTNASGYNYCSWTFRKQPKFFDVVTYTGDGTNGRAIAHNLGSTPGMIIVKSTSLALGWPVYHRAMATSSPESWEMYLNTTAARTVNGTWGGAPTSTNFYVNNLAAVNQSGDTYVAYLFAHDAGGFGLTGTDNVISCGSFTASSAVTDINLGYEPQWILIKRSDSAAGPVGWYIYDSMRGMPVDLGTSSGLRADTSSAEAVTGSFGPAPTATGFQYLDALTTPATFIYMAIRRGPMKTPTSGTSVFSPILWSGSSSQTLTPGFPTDLVLQNNDIDLTFPSGFYWGSRLQGNDKYLQSASTAAEGTFSSWDFSTATGTFVQSLYSGTVGRSIDYFMRRAPGFFDIVCYTGTGSARTVTHNLGVVPELMIVKQRDVLNNWQVYSLPTAATTYLELNSTIAATTSSTRWNNTTPTSSVFTVGANSGVNGSGSTYVAYLFATITGVSKVGSYTGTGATQTINCGFTGGARFVLIKGVDAASSWFVWDTARGMVSGTDPRLALNLTSAEVNQDWVYTTTTGFQIVTTSSAINTSGNNYIYLAIA